MNKRWFLAVIATLALGACGETEWRTKDISGLMPKLAFELTGESGDPITAERFEDHITLMFFGYTQCPDICPVTMGKLRAVMQELPDGVAGDTRVLFVSVDPDRDTPERLADYTDAFGERFIGATGTQEQLQALNKRYRVTYSYGDAKGEDNDYLVSHSSAVFAFDRQGEVRLMFRQDDDVAAIASDMRQLAR
jgi:protein SCO1/2